MARLSDVNLETIHPGTIKIDCLGAYIGNDILLSHDHEVSTDSSSSSELNSPYLSSTSDIDDDSMSQSFLNISISENNKVVVDTTKQLLKNITLPKHNKEIIHISVDIGGTLTKLVYFTKSLNCEVGGRLHFKDFQSENFQNEVLKFMIKLVQKSTYSDDCPPITNIMATGGGAHKFYKLMQKTFKKYQLPMKIIALDEMECLIKGLDWLITKIPHEIFTYDLEDDDTVTIPNTQTASDIYPYLLVNIGSGVSMIKVVGPGKHERIGGSSLGGGTLWGLLTLLTDAKDYNEMLEMAQQGDNNNIDLLVGDIYGTNYNKIGLKSNHIASSFAKVFKKLSGLSNKSPKQLLLNEKLANFRQEDIARSLLYAISNNLGQIAYLHALRFNLKRIYFGGSYISGHKQTIHTLSYAVNFWSKGDMKSYFLRHEGYLGSVGAFMMGPNSEYVDESKTVIEEKYPNNVIIPSS
jgi:type II pantothenate kinase